MYKVLIVDDEMIVRHAVQTLIRWDGSRFEHAGSAANGAAALELVRKTGADIVITDIKMPEMDGLELIKRLTEEGFGGEVLVLSNYNDFDLVREALKRGAHDYMLKLTLKTESFMKALEEMAAKLDEKRGGRHDGTGARESRGAADGPDRMPQLLLEMETAAEHASSWNGERFLGEGLKLYSFLILLRSDGQGERLNETFEDSLGKLAEGLFAGCRWMRVVRAGPKRFLLVAAYAEEASPVDPAELARRLISLASMYYSARIDAIYASAARDETSLAAEMSLSRKAESLLFYSSPRPGGLSNREGAGEDDEAYREAEEKLKISLRKTAAGAIDLWTESALNLIDAAADRRVHPRALKRAISGSVWSAANSQELGASRGWDEKPWLEKVEAAESDSQLKETIRELSEEIADSAGLLASLKPDAREEVRQAVRYLEEHYSDKVAIADVAARVGLSEPYLCQVFKADTGLSILTYLNEIRMTKAYELLSSGKYLVKQAALEVGIHDPFYFNRLFRKRFGIAPKNVKTN